jgi:hypothetical protein
MLAVSDQCLLHDAAVQTRARADAASTTTCSHHVLLVRHLTEHARRCGRIIMSWLVCCPAQVALINSLSLAFARAHDRTRRARACPPDYRSPQLADGLRVLLVLNGRIMIRWTVCSSSHAALIISARLRLLVLLAAGSVRRASTVRDRLIPPRLSSTHRLGYDVLSLGVLTGIIPLISLRSPLTLSGA